MNETEVKENVPFLARWETGNVVPVGSTKIGNDDTGTWNASSEDADT